MKSQVDQRTYLVIQLRAARITAGTVRMCLMQAMFHVNCLKHLPGEAI